MGSCHATAQGYVMAGRSFRQASHRGSQDSIPDQVICDLWWMKWHWNGFYPDASGFPFKSHSSTRSTLITIHGSYNRPIGAQSGFGLNPAYGGKTCIELGPSSEANSCSATVWCLKVHYRIHESLSLLPTASAQPSRPQIRNLRTRLR
jgi:hypothetical protein